MSDRCSNQYQNSFIMKEKNTYILKYYNLFLDFFLFQNQIVWNNRKISMTIFPQ